jgi:hypothetical protein
MRISLVPKVDKVAREVDILAALAQMNPARTLLNRKG